MEQRLVVNFRIFEVSNARKNHQLNEEDEVDESVSHLQVFANTRLLTLGCIVLQSILHFSFLRKEKLKFYLRFLNSLIVHELS